MKEKNKKIVSWMVKVIVFAFLAFFVMKCMKAMLSESRYSYDVTVFYQYEGDTVSHKIGIRDSYCFNSSIAWLRPTYRVPAGYMNRLVLSSFADGPKWNNHFLRNQELMYVPDRQFTVTEVTWKEIPIEK